MVFDFQKCMYEDYFNMQPSEVKGPLNAATIKESRYLWNLVYSCYRFGMPKEFSLGWFRFWLFQAGAIGICYTGQPGLEWVNGPFGVELVDYQMRPLKVQMNNKQLNQTAYGVRGLNFACIHILDDYFGLWDIVTMYAEKLAQIDKAININLMNCNVSKAFPAATKKDADTIKEAYGRATTGEPLILVNNKYFDEEGNFRFTNFFGDVKGDYIATDLQHLRREIVNEFLTKIGIRNANYDKRERLNSQEVEENNDETSALVSIMYKNIQQGLEECREIGAPQITCELNYDYMEEVSNNAENDSSRYAAVL